VAGRIPFWQVATGGAAGHRPTASRPVEARAAAAAARRVQGPSLSTPPVSPSLRAACRWPAGQGRPPGRLACRLPPRRRALSFPPRLDQASQPGRPAGRVRPGRRPGAPRDRRPL